MTETVTTSMEPLPPDGVSIVLLGPAPDESQLAPWSEHLQSLQRPFEWLHTPGTPGDQLRHGWATAKYPLVLLLELADGFTPDDFAAMLKHIEHLPEGGTIRLDIVNGFRTGRTAPLPIRLIAGLWRRLLNLLLDLRAEPAPGWLGMVKHIQARLARFLFGVRMIDLDSGMKLFRRKLLPRTPIQSHGRFALVEFLAKANFLVSYMDEIPVASAAGAENRPLAKCRWLPDFGKVFSKPDFGPTFLPDSQSPAGSPPESPPAVSPESAAPAASSS
ncbi:glycosyltransferase family protein [Tuwongella immobilis]|uniref:Uncharacterized protein n=1 Tax=Tuwongella immobilis TaxID=692036 RepID=A0A6C2YMA9_9BACT|nr:hypothetical protein [Tuwongella immobilis]VIP02359.1 unnamed protein product [Tuwongella immobilis]VTS01163.1 unnamed protein product [Tuwongella immobilis]